MKRDEFKRLLKWFKFYISGYLGEDSEENRPILLKETHTYRVCANIKLISKSMGLPPADILLAKTMALLHDLGRFEQYRRFRTFNDGVSQNHAALSIAEIKAHDLLSACLPWEAELIAKAVAAHNAAELLEEEDGRTLFFMRMLRDADKLDIWRVFCDYYRNRGLRPQPALDRTIIFDLPDRPLCSAAVVGALQEGRQARLEDLETLNDFKLLQISWVHDLNFPPAFKILRQRGYLEQIAAELPRTKAVERVVEQSLRAVEASAGRTSAAYSCRSAG